MSSFKPVGAAVLVPIFKKNSEWHVLYTRRTDTVKEHKGQISFPGGKAEATDKDCLDTALREAFEEIGLHPKDVEVMGKLDKERTVASNFIVHPFLGIIPYPYDFKLQEREVAQLIEVPLAVLIGEAESPGGGDSDYYPTYTYNGHVIWGATARITRKLTDYFMAFGELIRSEDSSAAAGQTWRRSA